MTKKMRVEKGDKITGKMKVHCGGFFKCLFPKMSLFLLSSGSSGSNAGVTEFNF